MSLEKYLSGEGGILVVPILHGRLEFAAEVRRRFTAFRPQALAVEFPPTIEREILAGVRRLPFLSVVLYQEESGQPVYVPIEPQDPLIETVRLGLEHKLPLVFADRDTESYQRVKESFPDSYSVLTIGMDQYISAYLKIWGTEESGAEDTLREMSLAYHTRRLKEQYGRVMLVCGLTHFPNVCKALGASVAQPVSRIKRTGVILGNLARDSSRETMAEIPYLARRYEELRHDGQKEGFPKSGAPPYPDRLALLDELLWAAAALHKKNSAEEVRPPALRVLKQFARNYALMQGYLTPDFYQLLIAARGAQNDNYAYEVWDLGSDYPWQEENSTLPTITVSAEDLWLYGRRIHFHRRFPQLRRRLQSLPIKKRPREARPGEWREKWEGNYICSYPPEDVIIEGYGDYLKKKAVILLSEENRRVEPFRVSMLDGLDVRATIRNFWEGKIYVRANQPLKGKAGGVVLIFSEDEVKAGQEELYPWCATWLGEHQDESDMAFYASWPEDRIVGPGIARCEYGGCMLTYPPRRLVDIWNDPFFSSARGKADRLAFAALDYCVEKIVVYVAARPPSGRAKSFAARLGKKLVYLPIGGFSPALLNKLKIFHVLDNLQVRQFAKRYIW